MRVSKLRARKHWSELAGGKIFSEADGRTVKSEREREGEKILVCGVSGENFIHGEGN